MIRYIHNITVYQHAYACNTIVVQISTVQETVASISCRDLCSHLIRFVQLFFLWNVIIRCFSSLLQLLCIQCSHSSSPSSCHVDSSFIVPFLVSSCSTSRALNQTHYCRTRSCTIDANTRGVNAYIPLLNFARQFALQREFSARELVT